MGRFSFGGRIERGRWIGDEELTAVLHRAVLPVTAAGGMPGAGKTAAAITMLCCVACAGGRNGLT
jgi:hypothetical protein